MRLKKIGAIALDLDGVLLKDTFSPVVKKMADEAGLEYTAELERNVFSRPRRHAAGYVIEQLGLDVSFQEFMAQFFEERKKYIQRHGAGVVDGIVPFFERLSVLQTTVVCYGGLERAYFEKELAEYINFFSAKGYMCTNDVRPGVKEVAAWLEKDASEVLFVDDVNFVAEAAKKYGAPFIGVPSSEPWSHQKTDMLNTGVKYIVPGIAAIDMELIARIDEDATAGMQWRRTAEDGQGAA